MLNLPKHIKGLVANFFKTRSHILNELVLGLADHINFRNGFFVEVGANDGVSQSNTLYFEKYMGWRGVLIEAIPALADKCRRNRPNCIVENCALVGVDYPQDTLEMRYCNLMSVVKGGMQTEEEEEEHLQSGKQFLRKHEEIYSVSVPAKTLSAVLEKHEIRHIDLLSLDVEGYEAEVLKGLDLVHHGPEFMIIECRYMKNIESIICDHYKEILVLSSNKSYSDILFRKK